MLNLIFSPLFVTFFLILTGCAVGGIKVRGISLNFAAVLICAVLYGIFISQSENIVFMESIDIYPESAKSYFANLSSVGTAIFVGAVGVSVCFAFSEGTRGKIRAAVTGAVMSLSAAGFAALLMVFDALLPTGTALGILSGSMTSTPALAAACEAKEISDAASAGYGLTYFFGVVIIVMFVQLFAGRDGGEKTSPVKENNNTSPIFNISVLAVSVIGGMIIGKIEFFGIFSLGNSGGMLVSGFIVALILAKRKTLPSESFFISFRGLGLMLFFVGSGVPAGVKFAENLNIKYIFYGMGITLFSIVCGVAAAKIMKIKEKNKLLSVVAGGMTSTPAISVLKDRANIGDFSVAYVTSLAVLTFAVRLIYTIFK